MIIFEWLSKKIVSFLMKNIHSNKSIFSDFTRAKHELRKGDVILVEGKSRIAKVIKKATKSHWTHAAIYVGKLHDIDNPESRRKVKAHLKGSDNHGLVIESFLGEGTIVSPLENYNQDHIRICRPDGLNHNDAQKVIDFAVDSLGQSYDTKHIFDLWRFCIGSFFIPTRSLSKLFSYEPGRKPAKDICSVMIASAFASIKFPILPVIDQQNNKMRMVRRNPWLCAPSDFDYSPYFKIIKYPITPQSSLGFYHYYPWDEKSISHD